jgi:DNA-binding NarL/FixJ family response regulator
MDETSKRVLIVEDQFLISEYLRIWLEAHGYQVCGVAKTAKKAVELALVLRPEIILMDMRLEGARDGVDAALEIVQTYEPRIIYVTGSNEPNALKRINEDHPFRIVIKPIDPAELMAAVMAA